MYIETGSANRWSSRRHGIVNVGSLPRHSDAASRPSHWNTVSVRNKARRPQAVQARSTNITDLQMSPNTSQRATVKNDLNETCANGPLHVLSTKSLDRTVTEDFSCIDAVYQQKLLDGSDNCACKLTPLCNYSPFVPEHMQNVVGPKALPTCVALRLKQRFEKRMQHKNAHLQELDIKRSGNSSRSFEKAGKYQLVAAFLVNEGHVEAWHIYSSLPVETNYAAGETPCTRTLELTQRRLRLLQRYYSGARQYIVLYVNSNSAEHYLPMGLASNQSHTNNRQPPKRCSHMDLFHGRNSIITRLLSSFNLSTRLPKSEYKIRKAEIENSNQRGSLASCPVSNERSQFPEGWRNRLPRDLSLPNEGMAESILLANTNADYTHISRPRSFNSFFRRLWRNVSVRRRTTSSRSSDYLCSTMDDRNILKHEKDSSSSAPVTKHAVYQR
ncbi:unnamed protein product [Dicrocoelium dendriticum]|nr:unnamed protein product [Dicrocoelium dendriticum]